MKLKTIVLAAALMAYAFAAQAITIDMVPVGNPGNAGELSGSGVGGAGTNRICGAVNSSYQIGKFEVTAGQYTAFLNAVAKTDTYNLYNTSMDTALHSYGCNIKRTGSWGNYSYSVAADWANRPVNYVSWSDAARFSNWLANGQPTGEQGAATTEDGSYALNGKTSATDLMTITRKAGATWVIPTEDEWYKAAYYKNDGVTGNYFDYPTGSNSVPSNVLGNPTDPGNNATFYNIGFTIGSPYYRTEVGAHENSESPYGTFDQGGNVWEWNETAYGSSSRGVRGGSWGFRSDDLAASGRIGYGPADESYSVGFRVASVPEPGSIIMSTGIAVMSLLYFWRKA